MFRGVATVSLDSKSRLVVPARYRDALLVNGGGRVVVRSHPSDDPGYAVLSVDDDGPGIPAEVLPVIFTAYARHTASERSPERPPEPGPPDAPADDNVGLGLSLAHGLTAAMGGALTVGSTSPAGTSMVLRLPRPAPEVGA